jgi:hypothetical protein
MNGEQIKRLEKKKRVTYYKLPFRHSLRWVKENIRRTSVMRVELQFEYNLYNTQKQVHLTSFNKIWYQVLHLNMPDEFRITPDVPLLPQHYMKIKSNYQE